jgi:hypothetical protein
MFYWVLGGDFGGGFQTGEIIGFKGRYGRAPTMTVHRDFDRPQSETTGVLVCLSGRHEDPEPWAPQNTVGGETAVLADLGKLKQVRPRLMRRSGLIVKTDQNDGVANWRGILDAALEIGRARSEILMAMRSAFERGDNFEAMRLAKALCGFDDKKEGN